MTILWLKDLPELQSFSIVQEAFRGILFLTYSFAEGEAGANARAERQTAAAERSEGREGLSAQASCSASNDFSTHHESCLKWP